MAGSTDEDQAVELGALKARVMSLLDSLHMVVPRGTRRQLRASVSGRPFGTAESMF